MEILVIIILGITGGVMIATVAVSGIYYSYRTKKAGKGKEKTAAKVTTSAPLRRSVRAESESFVVIQDESVVDFDSIPVQPETRRPIRYRFHIVWVTCGNLFSNECPIRSPCAYGICISDIHPLHPNINSHILHTVICSFTMVLTRRICQTITSSFSCWSFPLFSWHQCVIQWWYCKE